MKGIFYYSDKRPNIGITRLEAEICYLNLERETAHRPGLSDLLFTKGPHASNSFATFGPDNKEKIHHLE